MTSIEQTVAEQIVRTEEHQKRVAAWEARDRQTPEHFAFKMAFRDDVLAAMDQTSFEHSMPKVLDRDLPELFRALDALAEKLWIRSL